MAYFSLHAAKSLSSRELVRRGTVGHLHQAKMGYFRRNRDNSPSPRQTLRGSE
jgi:hypothetical protein